MNEELYIKIAKKQKKQNFYIKDKYGIWKIN